MELNKYEHADSLRWCWQCWVYWVYWLYWLYWVYWLYWQCCQRTTFNLRARKSQAIASAAYFVAATRTACHRLLPLPDGCFMCGPQRDLHFIWVGCSKRRLMMISARFTRRSHRLNRLNRSNHSNRE